MASRDSFPPLRERTITLLLNLATFYVAFVLATGRALPTGGIESVWLITAIAMWFLSLLSAPWFMPPRDALANAIAAAVILLTLDLSPVPQFRPDLNAIRWIAVLYCVAVAAVALAALFLHDRDERAGNARFLFQLSGILGKGEVLYTAPAIISIIGAFQQSYATIAWLIILWVFFTICRPFDRIAAAWRQWTADAATQAGSPSVGMIDRIDHPNIIRVRLNQGGAWKLRTLHVAAMPGGDQQFVLSLFAQVQGSEVIGTGLCVATVAEKLALPTGHVCASHDEEKTACFVEALSGSKGAELIGFTVEGSTIGTLRFEVAASSELAEGNVVFARIGGEDIFYQILDAETAEESFDRNPRGTHIVRAAQLGRYSGDRGFTKHPWLPAMNTPLFATHDRVFENALIGSREFEIGKVPSTNIGVVANADDLVDYHTAILGVTGTGKTELALDIVREAVKCGVKVFCVDFTDEYRQRLADLTPEFPAPTTTQARDLEAKLFAVEAGAYGGQAEKPILKKAIDTLRTQTEEQVDKFLRDPERALAIFALAEITNTKATLRLTELYLSSIMNWARQNRRAQRILIVLEEAHTIVPETFGAGFDYETQWVVGRIGQIALQGRKYGVGLLVVTQRTALVSKTILSQCNTFLTHSLIDQTSLNFLESVYSSQHTRLIPNLGRFEFLAFGKALRADRPVLLKRPFDPTKMADSEALRRPLEPQQAECVRASAAKL
jgi:hypothetical protein